MNTKFLSLSSVSTTQNTIFLTVGIVDHTLLTISLSGVTERIFPTHLTIDWGDNETDFFENDILQNQNIASNVFSSLLIDTYTHEYFPSAVSTSQSLTAMVALHYTNSDISTFTLPLSITNYDYVTSVGDVKLVNTDYLQSGSKIHQLVTNVGGYLMELDISDSAPIYDIGDSVPDIEPPPPTPTPTAMILSGMSGDLTNGTLIQYYDEIFARNYYVATLSGILMIVVWQGSEWQIYQPFSDDQFYSTEDVSEPHLVTVWLSRGGASGSPVLTLVH